ncbi:MAG: septation protein IspZ [Succinivibrio sp.]
MLVKILNFLPVVVFFISYKITSNLIVATALIIAACIASSVCEYLITKSLSRMQIFMIAAVLLFGIPTVLLKDPSIIKWKVTVVNFLLSLTIFVTQFILKKNPFAYLLGREIKLPDEAFASMSRMWMVFFVFSGLLNIVIAFYLPELLGITPELAEEIWVDYKSFGNAIINFVFAIICIFILIKKYPDALREEIQKNSK